MSQNTERNKPIVFKRVLWLLLLVCLGAYLVIVVVITISQRSLVFPAPKFSPQQVDDMARSANLERWTNSSGEFIGLKRLSLKQPAAGRLLIVYGNGNHAAGCAHYVDDIQSVVALDVFVLEYPGYADRPGKLSQKSFLHASDEAFQLLDTNKPVYLLGESLGTGVAAYLAGKHPDTVAGMILLSPYNRLTDVAQSYYPFLPVHLLLIDRFPTEDYLRNYHGPVGMLVDGRDTIVPEKFGMLLYNGYSGPKKLWEFRNGEHVAIAESHEKFWNDVIEFWNTKSVR
jgi:pimeloyl-ACP methyl ester carboxylesterase